VRQTRKPRPRPVVEVVILAGGTSSRMGRDKAHARIAGQTLLQHARAEARTTGWPVRVLRRDAVPKCGPLGGVLTALLERGTRNAECGTARVLVFLSCDMPFVSPAMIRRVAQSVSSRRMAAFFMDKQGRVGFPFALHVTALATVQRQLNNGRFSLQELAHALGARRLPVQQRESWRWFNVNTQADLAQARRLAARFAGSTAKRRLSARRKAVSSAHDSL
jgi:molybdopterin-guanine dinucleotide biosynthesis protein A